MKEAKAPWTTCGSESVMSYTETIYHSSLRITDYLTVWNLTAYAVSGYGMLRRNFSVIRCYDETK